MLISAIVVVFDMVLKQLLAGTKRHGPPTFLKANSTFESPLFSVSYIEASPDMSLKSFHALVAVLAPDTNMRPLHIVPGLAEVLNVARCGH